MCSGTCCPVTASHARRRRASPRLNVSMRVCRHVDYTRRQKRRSSVRLHAAGFVMGPVALRDGLHLATHLDQPIAATIAVHGDDGHARADADYEPEKEAANSGTHFPLLTGRTLVPPPRQSALRGTQ